MLLVATTIVDSVIMDILKYYPKNTIQKFIIKKCRPFMINVILGSYKYDKNIEIIAGVEMMCE